MTRPRDWDDEFDDAADDVGAALPVVLAAGRRLGPREMDALFSGVASRLTDAEADGFGKALQSIGKWAGSKQVRGIAGSILPMAGTAVGAIYGGPMGAQLGGALGQSLGGMVAGGGGGAARGAAPGPMVAPPQPPMLAQPPAGPQPSAGLAAPQPGAGGDGSTAAAKLLYLAQNPGFLSSLSSLALGSNGSPSVPVGGSQVPVGAFMNLASSLLSKATEDAHIRAASYGDAESSDGYLRDALGRLFVDPAVPEQRAEALMRLLQAEDDAEAEDSVWDGEDGDDEGEDLDDRY